MFNIFLDIAFEAEVNIEESAVLLDLAKTECNESSATRKQAVAELRNMIKERAECQPHRSDECFLLRFLRARDFILPKPHRLLVRYCEFRKHYLHLYDGVDFWGLSKAKGAFEGTMIDRPDVGRLSIWRLGTWDPNEFSVEELLRAGTAMVEIATQQPKLQVVGFTVIIDLEGISVRQVSLLAPTIAHQISSLMGLATPVKLKSCHIINYTWILSTFFYLFKKSIPQQMWGKIYFCGCDLKSLQQHIDPKCLPVRYGGTCRNHSPFDIWLNKIKMYRNEQFDKEMKGLGYLVKE